MAVVKSVKLDGEEIRIFNSAIFLFESSTMITLECNIIISEVTLRKYEKVENVIVEIELEDGRMINSIMHVKAIKGKLPQMNLFCEIGDSEDLGDIMRISENDSQFPNIEEGITLEEIRKVEMPNEKVTIKVTLPIDQVEWLKAQKPAQLSQTLNEMIMDYWRKHN